MNEEQASWPTPARVLVLDDEAPMCRHIGEVAAGAGLEPTLTYDARTFLATLSEEHDVAVLDLVMPGMDGVELIMALAARDRPPELILVSGLEDRVIESAAAVAISLGLVVRGGLHKPFRNDELTRLLLRSKLGVVGGRGVRAQPAARFSRDDLLGAIERRELILHYQPQVRLVDGAWIGAEALVRWQHPELGLIPPDRFLHAASDPESSRALTSYVLSLAAADWNRLRGQIHADLRVSVNVPADVLGDRDFVALAGDVITSAGLATSSVTLEVTETLVPADETAALGTLTRLRLLGFGLSIDDYGTGHSTLERLHRVPFTELKIDRQFVSDIVSSPSSRTIAAQSIALARGLGLATVAEGVEDEAALAWLAYTGCGLAQGFHISRPVALDALPEWRERWQERRPALPSHRDGPELPRDDEGPEIG